MKTIAEKSGHDGNAPVLVAVHVTDIHLQRGWDVADRFRAALRHIRRCHPQVKLVLNTGDTAGGCPKPEQTLRRYQLWREVVAAELSGLTLRNILGNHERDWLPAAPDAPCGLAWILRHLDMPARYYSFTEGGWRFIALDGWSLDRDDLEQRVWLQRELDAVPAATPVAILCHQPIWSMCTQTIYPGDMLVGHRAMTELFVRYPNVRLTLGGHVHLHEICTYNGVTHVCGGAVCGNWWKKDHSFHETDPGYGLVEFYADGAVNYRYHSLRGITTDPVITPAGMPDDWSYLKED